MPDATETSAREAGVLVAESYPPLPAVTPVRTWRVHWLLAFPAGLVAMVFPRRLGPHLAASSWTAAYVAHVLSAALYWGALFAMVASMSRFAMGPGAARPALGLSERLREPLAALVVVGYEMLDNWPAVVGMVIGIMLFEGGLWLAAVALIPMYAVGERRALVYLRSVKLLLWSSVCAVPLGYTVAWLLEPVAAYSFLGGELIGALWLLWTVWWLSVLLRLGGRYGGPAQGPGWEPRVLRCEACGYALTMQPVTGRCPECGRAVADSLPGRRGLPAYATAKGWSGWWSSYWQTVWSSLRAQRFAESICLWQGHRSARRFAYLMCVCVGLLVGAASVPHVLTGTSSAGILELYEEFPEWGWLLGVAMMLVTAGCIGGLICLAVVLFGGVWATLFGFLDATRRSVVLCYSTAWLLLPTVLGIVGYWATAMAYDYVPALNAHVVLPLLGRVECGLILAMALMLPSMATFLLWFFHLRRMLRTTRFANG